MTVKKSLRLLSVSLFIFCVNAHADVLEEILDRGTMRVGVSLFEPWTMQNDAGHLSGFEIEVADRLASDMGVKPEYKVYKWEEIMPALIKGEIDIIAGGMAITPQRALKINFSGPYADSGISLAANTSKTKNIKKLEDLNHENISVAVVSKTVSNELAPRLFNKSTLKVFDTTEQAEKAILDGDVHIWLASMPIPQFLGLRHPDKVDLPLAKPVLSYKAGFGVRKREQEWLNFLNAWVTARQADKWLSATHKYWFQSLRWSTESGE
ncbi:MAG: transporter substrate-binding domain-containing protein [Gammaproteobacteria bacterium]